MNNPDPNHHESHAEMREALRHDAARIEDPPFTAALHYATMRQIRAHSETPRTRPVWKWALSGATALALIWGSVAVLSESGPLTRQSHHDGNRMAGNASRLPRATSWTYRQAAARSDETLLTLLDEDARALLTPTAPAFSNPFL